MFSLYPKRIVCLTEETTEILYNLGEQDRICGISGFTVRPKTARKEKPVISTFLDANIEEILNLKPDLVVGFSDIQADIAKQLISKGVTVLVNNHRTVRGILQTIVQIGSLVGKSEKANEMINGYQTRLNEIQRNTTNWTTKPKVYFEEWYDPLISGISWVSELIEIAGGKDIFKDLASKSLAKDRIIANPQMVVDKNPDIIVASWCGKMFKKEKVVQRKNWNQINAIQTNDVYEINSSIILQPGPASITEGIETLHTIFKNWTTREK